MQEVQGGRVLSVTRAVDGRGACAVFCRLPAFLTMSEKNKIKSYVLIFACVVLFIAVLDYYVKSCVESTPLFRPICVIAPFVTITHLRNYGGAFSILQNQTLFLVSVGILVPLIIVLSFRKAIVSDFRYTLACAAVCGGAVGNLIDRLAYGYVVDYISVGSFPVFNISDSFITVGAVFLGIFMLFDKSGDGDGKDRPGNGG